MPPKGGGVGFGTIVKIAREGGYDGLSSDRSPAKTFAGWEKFAKHGQSANDNAERAQRRVIQLQGGELPRNVDDAEKALIETKAPLYQRGHQLVQVGEATVEVRGGKTTKDLLLVPWTTPP